MKMYTKPEIEISVFATEDIITTSAGGGLDDSTTTTYGLKRNGALSETNSTDVEYTDLTLS
ncbi:MAG: hypothetical protein IJ385_02840 [Ruminiclostridium sp.]|nr:hypothetical protein [Ruminiclostridium sp.]